jgi:hypothetical protein
MTNESMEELVKILRTSKDPLSTQEILRKVKDKCPDASMSMLVTLMDSGVIMGKWVTGKGYFWMLPSSNSGGQDF